MSRCPKCHSKLWDFQETCPYCSEFIFDYDECEKKILKSLFNPKTLSEIVKYTEQSSGRISYILSSLHEKNIIDIENLLPNQKKIYGLTSLAEEYVKNHFGMDIEGYSYNIDYWRVCNYILKYKNRLDILKYLMYESKSPSEISEYTGLAQSNVSTILKELSEKYLIVCFNPEARSKLFGLTDYGANAVSYICHMNNDPEDLLCDLYFEEHFFQKDVILTLNKIKFKFPKGFSINFFEDWESKDFFKELRNASSYDFDYGSNKLRIVFFESSDREVFSYNHPFERNINGIVGIQSSCDDESCVFSYELDDKVIVIYADDEEIFSKILIG